MTLREINLIPADKPNKKNISRRIFFWAGCLTLCLSLILGFYLYEAQVVLPKKRHVVTLEDMHKQMETNREETKDTQQKIQHLSLRESLLKDPKAKRINSKNSTGTTSGNVRSFTTKIVPPNQAINPMPANGLPTEKQLKTFHGAMVVEQQVMMYILGQIQAQILENLEAIKLRLVTIHQEI